MYGHDTSTQSYAMPNIYTVGRQNVEKIET